MKKFIVGLLGIFIMLGASILSACGTQKAKLEVQTQSVSIQLNDESQQPTATVYFTVTGSDDKTIQQPYFTDNDIAKVDEINYLEDGKGEIIVKGINEGSTQLVLTCQQGGEVKYVDIEVYSEVTEMYLKNEDVQNKSNRFAIVGDSVELIAGNFFNFEPASSNRKDVVWTFEATGSQEYAGAFISGNILTLPEDFAVIENPVIYLTATTHLGVSATVGLTCIEKITTDSIDLGIRKSKNASFEFLSNATPDGNGQKTITLNITPNIGDGENIGYIAVKYFEDLVNDFDITGIVRNKNGVICDDLIVVSEGYSQENGYEFSVIANEDLKDEDGNKIKVNSSYFVSFKIGYSKFDYSIDTNDLNLGKVVVDAKEKINDISIKKDNLDATLTAQKIYSQYSSNSGYGQLYTISLTPDTVLDVSGNIKLYVTLSSTPATDACPIEVYKKANGVYSKIDLVWDQEINAFVSPEIESTQVSILNHELYIKANENFLLDANQNNGIYQYVNIEFASVDNPNVSKEVRNISLIKSSNEINFINEVDEIFIDSSTSNSKTVSFIMQGQSSIDGLSVLSESLGRPFVSISQPYFLQTNNGNVEFYITFTLKDEYVGTTSKEAYFVLTHENGAESEPIYFNIVYPLTDASVTFTNETNDITIKRQDNDLFIQEITEEGNGQLQRISGEISDSVLMLKNGKTIPFSHNFNKTITNISALANISASYLDFAYDENVGDYDSQLIEFLSKFNTESGKIGIINDATNNGSNVVSINYNFSSLETKGVGYTYVVLSYQGINSKGNNVVLYRVLLIESYQAITQLSIEPSVDKSFVLYAQNSVSNYEETVKTINIEYSRADATYVDPSNFVFKANVAGKEVTGTILNPEEGEDLQNLQVVWYNDGKVFDNTYFDLHVSSMNGRFMRLMVSALSTNNQQNYKQTLQLFYSISSSDNKFDNISIVGDGVKADPYLVSLDFTIINADRVEELIVDGIDEDGLYFEIGNANQSSNSFLVKTSPTNAKESGVEYFVIDDQGRSDFVTVNSVSNNRIRVDLSSYLLEGTEGKIYLFPSDAVINGVINYQYYEQDELKNGSVFVNQLNYMKSGSSLTNYEWLVQNAFFINNQGENIYFKEFFHCYEILVADGLSFNFAYRVYSEKDFREQGNNLFFTVMNDIELTKMTSNLYNEFTGGLQGKDGDETITLSGYSFANTIIKNGVEGGIVRNIKFNGEVTQSSGFVANENQGTIINVTIDTNGLYSSILDLTSNSTSRIFSYIGGICGTNEGTIQNCSVLGLQINGKIDEENGSTVGGITGKNSGTLERVRVEFYNLQGENATKKNTFNGNIVGGVVGENSSETIFQAYAYDYNLTSNSSESDKSNEKRLNGNTFGAIVGKITKEVTKVTFDQCFAFVDNIGSNVDTPSEDDEIIANSFVGNSDGCAISILDSYISYYNEDQYTSIVKKRDNSSAIVSKGSIGFNEKINGGQPHILTFYQDEKIDTINLSDAVIKDTATNLYKLITDGENIVFFYNGIDYDTNTLTSSQLQDFKQLNTISISQLLGFDNKNIIVQSDSSSLIVTGSEIYIQSLNQSFTLNIYSKQDVSQGKEFNATIEKAVSDVVVISQNSIGQVEQYTHDVQSKINLQKTKSKEFVANFETTSVYLGSEATEFKINMIDSFEFEIINQDSVESENTNQQDNTIKVTQSGNTFNVLSRGNEELKFSIYPSSSVSAKELIKEELNVALTINPIDGAIEIGIANDSISISPSSVSTTTVSLLTTEQDDKVVPIIYIVGSNEVLTKLTPTSDGNIITYSLNGENRIEIHNITDENTSFISTTSSYLKNFTFSFAIKEEYKDKVKSDEIYKVEFVAENGYTSSQLTLNVNKQKISMIDVSNYKVTNTNYTNKQTIYTISNLTTGVMAPGTSSIMQVSINPQYAYYDYMEVSYANAKISNGVIFVPVEKVETNGLEFTSTSDIVFERLSSGNGFRYYPTKNNKDQLYFLTTINGAIPEDCNIEITISYFTFDQTTGQAIRTDYVKTYIFVSYLAEPSITIDGKSSVLLAKGGSAVVEIVVNMDQKVEGINLSGAKSGIDYYFIESITNTATNKITYKYLLTANILAKSENEDGRIYLNATVVREINNQKESKTVTATVTIVDFKINEKSSYLDNSQNGNLDVYVNVNQVLQYNYVFDPEKLYYDEKDDSSTEAYNSIMDQRNFFTENQYYPEINSDGTLTNPNKDNYLINVVEEKGLTTKYSVIPLIDRIYYVIGNSYFPVTADNVNSPFKITVNDGKINIFATAKTEASIQIMIETYVTINGELEVYEQIYTLKTVIYSDLDLPIAIDSAEDFLNLSSSEENTQHDYILMNDIVLENYIPFNTDYISSFDGNGHTIHIKSFDISSQSGSLNLALFNNINENTLLKNVRVNLYNGGRISVNVNDFNQVNIAGFAIENNGIITNCEVVSYYTDNYSQLNDAMKTESTYKQTGQSGIIINYFQGNSTKVNMQEGSTWSSNVAGFVLNNNGNITNSRVGGDKIIELGQETASTGLVEAKYINLETFNIVAQGQVAGFVLQNQSAISACYVKNLGMENNSITEKEAKAYASGFVGLNNGSIITSYVEGVKQPLSEGDVFTRLGSEIKSNLCVVTGFVLTNNNDIKDCYSNIKISSIDNSNPVYLASGFVYRNEGYVENCYSASQIENQKYYQMNFSGISADGELLANGEYVNCYYYNQEYSEEDSATGASTESDFDTNVLMVPDPSNADYFYGFAIASFGEEDGIWYLDTTSVIEGRETLKLIEPDMVTFSYRYKQDLGTEIGSYILPYGSILLEGEQINTTLGSKINPIIIEDAERFVEATGSSSSTPIQNQYNDKAIFGTYRLVDDIDMSAFSSQTITLPSTQRAFSGNLYGNGFTLSNLSLTYSGSDLSYGLFKSVEIYNELRDAENPKIINLNIDVSSNLFAPDVIYVGALAGYIKDTLLINLDINFSNNAQVQGKNFVGSIAGMITNTSIIKNVEVSNPNIHAVKLSSQLSDTSINLPGVIDYRSLISILDYNYTYTGNDKITSYVSNYSYAGGIAGYVDIYAQNQINNYFEYVAEPVYTIVNAKVDGVVKIIGQVAGGLFGLTGQQTAIQDAGIVVSGSMNQNSSHILTTKDYAGGVIGQSYGYISKIYAQHEDSVQNNIESNIALYYLENKDIERGILDLFMPEDSDLRKYDQKAIGGLIGYVGSGALEVAYSKLNVISTTADSAGGIIGQTDLGYTRSYLVENNKVAVGQYTRYLFNEVYSVGEVRASKNGQAKDSGGMIGTITNSNDRVAILSSNAINFFTNINYDTNTTYTNSEISNIVYQFVGGAKENVSLNTSVSFWIARKEGVDGNSTSTTSASVGYVIDYKFGSDDLVEINLYKDYKNSTVSGSEESATYVVEGIYTYTSGTMGYQATQKVFLNSGVWSVENWSHAADKIFPDIKYSLADPSIIYLDSYASSITRVLTAMRQNPTITVVVRGLKEGQENQYADVDLSSYLSNYQIMGFGGTITSSADYQVEDGDSTRQVRLIVNDSLLQSTSLGFSISNTHILYVNNQNIVLQGGIISARGIEGASIDGLKIFLGGPVSYEIDATEFYAGLLAPTLTSSQINSLYIDTLNLNGNVMEIKVDEDFADKCKKEGLNVNLNIGLISGNAIQRSETSVMYIRNVFVNTQAQYLIMFNIAKDININKTNVGLYFGSISKALPEENGRAKSDFRLEINSIYNSQGNNLNMTGMSIIGNQINAGGYVGEVDNLSSFGVGASSVLNSNINITVTNSCTNANIGGIFGSLSGGNEISIIAENSSSRSNGQLNLNVENTTEITGVANIGGVIGASNTQTVISNLDLKTDFETNISSNDNQSSIGGLIGYNEAKTTINSIKIGNSNAGINLTVKENTPIAVGSVVGYSTASGLILSKNNGGYILSDLDIAISNPQSSTKPTDSPYYVGGLVGYYSNRDGAELTSSSAYTGDIKFNLSSKSSNSIFAGGIFGYVDESNFAISNTVFGGKIIVATQTSDNHVYAGGTVGYIKAETIKNAEFKIDNAYNYGDVFINYGNNSNNTLLSDYYFGGIIGNINGNNKATLSNCYSAVTNHNARLASSGSSTTNAIIGGGSIDGSTDVYYNSAVCLAFDTQATDIGYNASSNKGYSKDKNEETNIYIIDKIKGLNQSLSEFETWLEETENINWHDNISKLNPSLDYTENGSDYDIKYYTASVLSNDSNLWTLEKVAIKNVAIVGNFVNFDLERPVQEMNGWSSISGINFNIKYDDDNTSVEDGDTKTTKVIYGGLVDQMSENSIIYGVGVNGSMSIGGTSEVTMGGIVGQMTGGLIAESYTNIDMIYRAGKTNDKKGTISAIANYTGVTNEEGQTSYTNAYIDYTYATGSVVTYIDANMYAFASGTTSLNISNSYTIAKLDWNDYTSAQTAPSETTTIGVFSGATKTNSYFDINGINYNMTDTTNKRTTTNFINSGEKEVYNGDNWIKNVNFNYGYPTRGFVYLKQSSWAERGQGDSTAKTDPATYDDCITTYTYTKVENGEKPSTSENSENNKDYSYMIPNAGILAKISSIINETNNATNFVLMYDMDLSNTEYNNKWVSLSQKDEDDEDDKELGFAGVELDGQDKTIVGLNTSLFNTLSGTVRNLRLTEINIDTTINTSSTSGALANIISGGTVSNMTLEGTINIEKYVEYAGALANTITSGKIDTVTSMVKIDSTGNIGAIAGSVSGTVNINFCSNYGPLNTTGNAAGGIVGQINNYEENEEEKTSQVTINYCFNGSSVLSGYTEESGENYLHYAGGIVGINQSEKMTVSNCYNAGMIKAGNKNNTSMSYAAGIVADSIDNGNKSLGEILNCYNEGPIEALGINPTYKYVVNNVSIENGKLVFGVKPTISLVQDCNKNVSAFYISNIASDTSSYNEDIELFRNGALIDNGKSYYTIDYLYNTYTFENYDVDDAIVATKEEQTKCWIKAAAGALLPTSNTIYYFLYVNLSGDNFEKNSENNEITIKEQTINEQGIYALEKNNIGLPIKLTNYQKLDAKVKMYDTSYASTQDGYVKEFSTGSDVQSPYDKIIYGKNGEIEKLLQQTYENEEYILQETNKQKEYNKNNYSPSKGDTDNIQTVKVNNNYYYYLADKYSEAFESSTYVYKWTKTIANLSDTNKDNYKIAEGAIIKSQNGTTLSDIQNKISIDVEGNTGNGVKLNLTYISNEELINPQLSATIEYRREQNINFNQIGEAESPFIYINENSFAIDLNNVLLAENDQNSLESSVLQYYKESGELQINENTYNNIIKFTSEGIDYYFVYDVNNNQLIYYFDAVYNNNDVNVKGDTFKTIYDYIISFMSKTFTANREKMEDVTLECNNETNVAYSAKNEIAKSSSYNGHKVTFNDFVKEGGEMMPSYNYYYNGSQDAIISILNTEKTMLISISKDIERFSLLDTTLLKVPYFAYFNGNFVYSNLLIENVEKLGEDENATSFVITLKSNTAEYFSSKMVNYYFQLKGEIINSDSANIVYDPNLQFDSNTKISKTENNITFITTYSNYSIIKNYSHQLNGGENNDLLFYNRDLFINGVTSTATVTYNTVDSVSITNNNNFAVVYSYKDSQNQEIVGVLDAKETINLSNISDFKVHTTVSGPILSGDLITIGYENNSLTYALNLAIKSSEDNQLIIDWYNSSLYKIDESGEEQIVFDDDYKAMFNIINEDNHNYLYLNGAIGEILGITKNESSEINIKLTIPVNVNEEEYYNGNYILLNNIKETFEINREDILYENIFNIENKTVKTIFKNYSEFELKVIEKYPEKLENATAETNANTNSEKLSIILTNDIFLTSDTPLALGYNVYGNGYSMIVTGNSNNKNMFSSLGEETTPTLLNDLYIAGTTNSSTFAGESNVSFKNVKVFGMLIYSVVSEDASTETTTEDYFTGIKMEGTDLYISMFNTGNKSNDIKVEANSIAGHIVAADGNDKNKDGGNIDIKNVSNFYNVVLKSGNGQNGKAQFTSLNMLSFIYDNDFVENIRNGLKGEIIGYESQKDIKVIKSSFGLSGGIEIDVDQYGNDVFGKAQGSTKYSAGFTGETLTYANSYGVTKSFKNATLLITSPHSYNYRENGCLEKYVVLCDGGSSKDDIIKDIYRIWSEGRGAMGTDYTESNFKYLKYFWLDAEGNPVHQPPIATSKKAILSANIIEWNKIKLAKIEKSYFYITILFVNTPYKLEIFNDYQYDINKSIENNMYNAYVTYDKANCFVYYTSEDKDHKYGWDYESIGSNITAGKNIVVIGEFLEN